MENRFRHWSQVDGRTPTTNSLHQGTPGQHWMSARPMSAHFLHDLHPCFTTGFDGFAPVFGEGLVWGLVRPCEWHYSRWWASYDSPNRSNSSHGSHLPDGPGQGLRWYCSDRARTRFYMMHVARFIQNSVAYKPELRVATGLYKQNQGRTGFESLLPSARRSCFRDSRSS